MLAEWSAECAVEDPILVVPWADPESPAHFVDLRENPYDLDHLPEAEQHPPLMHALRSLNAPRSPVFTAKCDAWVLAPDELESLLANLDHAPGDGPAVGFASYIDLLWRDRSLFASLHQQEQLLDRFTRRATLLDQTEAAIECVLRPAMIDFSGPQEGFAISLYVKAHGPDADSARAIWGAALEAAVALLRSKDFASA